MGTQLTDFIPAQVLEREGYIHMSDSAAMLAKIDKGYMAEQGWVNITSARKVRISIRKAAEIAGCAADTLAGYVKLGFLTADEGNRLSLAEVLTFDISAAKRAYLDSKSPRASRRRHG
jgi:hypothetical protein